MNTKTTFTSRTLLSEAYKEAPKEFERILKECIMYNHMNSRTMP